MGDTTFTQEQLDAILAEKIAEATKDYVPKSDVDKLVTKEVDRRVESGIQKGLETAKSKWETEFKERAQLSAEELAKKEFDEKIKGLSSRESEIAKRENKIDAKEMLSDANIPKSHYDGFLAMLVSDDVEVTKTNVQNFINMYSASKSEIETKVKSEFTNIKPPTQGNGSKVISKEDFHKMGYADKMKFKTEHPDLFNEYFK